MDQSRYEYKYICPECRADKKNFNYDIYLDELSCRKCGLVIDAPYVAGLIFPGVKVIRVKL